VFEQGKGPVKGSYSTGLLNVFVLFVLGHLLMHFIVRFQTWRISETLAIILAFLHSTKRKMLGHIATPRHVRLSQKEEVAFLRNQVKHLTNSIKCGEFLD
jgi:hypothetical protein